MSEDILQPNKQAIENYKETDVFAWANNTVPHKEELKIDLFLVNKNYVPYKVKAATQLRKKLEPLFVDGIINYLLDGAEDGLIIRGFEDAENEDGVLQRTQVFKVEKAQELLRWINTQENELEVFDDETHDFRRIKGVVARITHESLDHPALICKVLPSAAVMSKRVSWMLREGKFVPFDADAALKIPHDNQLLILDQDIYVFSQPKLKQLFGYDAKEASIAEKKVEEILGSFKLSFPEGMDMQSLVAGKKSAIKKLQTIDPSIITQEQLIDHADEMGVELMEDEQGAIIIMDGKDLDKFVNLLNDDYIESNLTGQRYEVVRKKMLKLDEDAKLKT